MRALVVYESMYGNTHTVAEAVADGLRDADGVDEVEVVPVAHAGPGTADGFDLVVVGGPTHVHGMSRPSTRQSAVTDAETHPEKHLALEPDTQVAGVREWLATVHGSGTAAAAFDTRVDVAAVLSGRASKAIAKALRHHGFHEVVPPESFLVTKETVLEDGEVERARSWGRTVAGRVPTSAR